MLFDYSVFAAGAGVLVAATAAAAVVRPALSARPTSLRRVVASLRGWHVADRVRLDEHTLDHVIVAPAALLAVTAAGHVPGPADLHAAEQAAQRVRTFVRHTGVADAVVVPVLLVNGAAAPVGGHDLLDGVHVVDDAAPHAWLRLFREARIDAAPRIAVARALDGRAAGARRTRRRAPVLLAPPEPAGA